MQDMSESVRMGGSCVMPIVSQEMLNSNLCYLDVISVENVNGCFWKVGPVNCPHCQNQRIRRDDLSVTSDDQLKTQIIHHPNEPVDRK